MDERRVSPEEGPPAVERPKKEYHRPELREFGRVQDLTLGASGAGVDAGLTDFPP